MTIRSHPPGERKCASSGRTIHHNGNVEIDWDFYLQILENSDAPDEQKYEMILALWNICVAFVDLGFGVHPVQQTVDGKISISDMDTSEPNDLLNLTAPNSEIFESTEGTGGKDE
jgi:hypothetical protein